MAVRRLRAAPIFSQSVEREAKKNDRAKFSFASRSTDHEKIGAARSLGSADRAQQGPYNFRQYSSSKLGW